MDNVTRAGITWGEYYRGLGIAGLFGVVASLADVPVFAAADPLLVATGALALFAVSTGYQLCTARRGLLGRIAGALGRS
jgi:energy-converting hydrogenase Eha subunit H